MAGEKLTTVSGRDTTLAGANLTARDVDMHVGRDLTVASLQDTSSMSSSSYNLGGGFTVGYGANWDTLFNKGQQNPSGKYKEQYQASVSGSIAEGHSNTVGEQTSILGSESVNIYTEGNTHVAGAIIAALNDNLKLDTATLSYENLVGKTTSTSTSAGINWNYSLGQKGNGKKPVDPSGHIGDSSITGNQSKTQTQAQREADKKRLEEEKKKKEDEFYKHTPGWLRAILEDQKDAQKIWNNIKIDNLYGVSPGKFEHTEKETTQTAYATIGTGEIIVRENPGQSLDGLNRDPSQAMKTEQTTDVNIELKPAFSYLDDLLNGWGWPDNLKGGIDFFSDPKAFLNTLQDELAKSIPLLKRPMPQVNTTNPAANTSPEPSTSSPQAATQD